MKFQQGIKDLITFINIIIINNNDHLILWNGIVFVKLHYNKESLSCSENYNLVTQRSL